MMCSDKILTIFKGRSYLSNVVNGRMSEFKDTQISRIKITSVQGCSAFLIINRG